MARIATKKGVPGKVSLPRGTRRVGGLVLGTKSRAARVDRAERKRAAMYALIEAHPESAEELLARVASARNISAAKPKGKAPSARPKLIDGYTSSPTVPGAQESIQRVFDGLEAMLKRKQLGKQEYRAAMHIRAANDVVNGSPGGVMDLDRVRGGGSSGPQSGRPYLEAAETLRLVKHWLYTLDHRLIELVVISGYSISAAAAIVHRRAPTRTEKEEAGQRLKIGLQEVAERMLGRTEDDDDAPREMRAAHAPDAKTYTPANPGVIARGHVVHATGQRVFRNK